MDNIKNYTVIDLEMTGLSAKNDKIIELGAAKIRNGELSEKYQTLVDPKIHIPERVQELTGITDEEAAAGADMDEAVMHLIEFIGNDEIVGHNVVFDYSFIKQWAANKKIPLQLNAFDTLKIARKYLPAGQSKKLEDLCVYFRINRQNAHRALDDAVETYQIFEKLKKIAIEKGQTIKSAPLVYKAKRQTPATKHQIERLKEYMVSHNIIDVISWETLTRSQASRLYDEYLAKYGRK